MTYEPVFYAIWSLLGIFGIIYLLFWRYKIYQVDKYRDQMFALRNDLFDEADAGLIEFDHPAYGMLRSTINGFIRFGHRLTWWHIIFVLILCNRNYDKETSFEKRWTRYIKDFDENTKTRLNNYRLRMEEITINHLIWSTPEFWPLLLIVTIIIVIVSAIRSSSSSITLLVRQAMETSPVLCNGVDNIDNAAFVYGS